MLNTKKSFIKLFEFLWILSTILVFISLVSYLIFIFTTSVVFSGIALWSLMMAMTIMGHNLIFIKIYKNNVEKNS